MLEKKEKILNISKCIIEFYFYFFFKIKNLTTNLLINYLYIKISFYTFRLPKRFK